MSDFIPPYPPRPIKPLSTWRRLLLARQNFLAMWKEDNFDVDFSAVPMTIQARMEFDAMAASPATVSTVCLVHHG